MFCSEEAVTVGVGVGGNHGNRVQHRTAGNFVRSAIFRLDYVPVQNFARPQLYASVKTDL